MKYFSQILMIFSISFVGELLHFVLPVPVPASVYGLVLMLLSLQFKWIKLPQVEQTADFLIALMPLMFIPSGVGLLVLWADLKSVLVPIIIINLMTTVIVLVVSGTTVQWVGRLQNRVKK